MEIRLTATERHLSYGITQCYYLPPDTGERTRLSPQSGKLVLDLRTVEGWKSELTWVAGYVPEYVTCPQGIQLG